MRSCLPKVGVGCIVFDEIGRILLIKRLYPPGRGRWSIPGGHVEKGEDVLEAAKRELYEETGIDADPVGVMNVDTLIVYDEKRNIKYHYVLIDILFTNPRGELKAGDDATEAGFFDLDEALKMNLTDSVRGLLMKIIERKISIEKIIPHNKYVYSD
ncbi:MAG: NUDIX hydrolase [Desulfurococcales archaeon]|nr:NUDIX hydrolase [Desulfurococcales archaeon]